MKITIEAFGRRIIDLELLTPAPAPHPAPGTVVPSYDPRSTISAHIETGNDGVNGWKFGFGPVVIARTDRQS